MKQLRKDTMTIFFKDTYNLVVLVVNRDARVIGIEFWDAIGINLQGMSLLH